MKLKTIIILVLIALILIIFIQNTQVVTLKILFWKISMSRIFIPLLILIGFFLGFLVARVKKNY